MALQTQPKKIALLLALAWTSPLSLAPSFAQDKPPVSASEPATSSSTVQTIPQPGASINKVQDALPPSFVPPPVNNVSSNASNTTASATSGVTASAQQEAENDLLKLYRQAALSDPTFTAARYAYLAGKEKFWQGLSVLLPQVTATGSETKNDFTKRGNSEQNFMSRAWTVKLTQPLLNWDKFEQMGQGNLNSAIAEAQFAAAEQDLVIRVTEAYFNVLNAQDTLNLNRNKKALISEQLEQAKRNFEVGTATITDTHEAQSRYDLVVAQELAAEADLLIKRSALEQITGAPIGNLKSLSSQAKIEVVAK